MFAFETFLLQSDVIESLGGLLLGAAGLVGAVSAIVVAFIKQRATGRKLTEHEQKIVNTAEFAQVGAQKTTENIGEIKAIGNAIKKLSLTPEQQAIADKEIAPLIDQQTERIQVARDQVGHFKKLLGVNVDTNMAVPREAPPTLRKINEDQR